MGEFSEELKKFADWPQINRAENIPDGDVRGFQIIEMENGTLISAFFPGRRRPLLVAIDTSASLIIHACQDWIDRRASVQQFCKHVTKVFLMMPEKLSSDILNQMAESLDDWKFEHNYQKIEYYRLYVYEKVAESMIRDEQYEQAIQVLSAAANMTKDAERSTKLYQQAAELCKEHLISPLQILQVAGKARSQKQMSPLVDQVFEAGTTILNELPQVKNFFTRLKQIQIFSLPLRHCKQTYVMEMLERAKSLFKDASGLKDKVALAYAIRRIASSKPATQNKANFLISQNQRNEIIKFLTKEFQRGQICFAEQEDMQRLIECTRIFDIQGAEYFKRLTAEHEIRLKDIERIALKRKAAFLLGFLRAHKIKVPLSFYDTGGYLGLKHVETEGAAKYLLAKAGLEGKGTYIVKEDFVHNYPVFAELAESESQLSINTTRQAIIDFWGTTHPKLEPLTSHTIAEDAGEYQAPLHVEGIIVEWDLLTYPRGDEIIGVMSDGQLILLDPTAILSPEIMPFDLTICDKTPVSSSDTLKILRPIQKINSKEAIEGIQKGMSVISTYRPLNLVSQVVVALSNSGAQLPVDEIEKIIRLCEENSFVGDVDDIVEYIQGLKEHIAEEAQHLEYQNLKRENNPPDDAKLKRLFKEVMLQFSTIPLHILNIPKREAILRNAFKESDTLEDALTVIDAEVEKHILEQATFETPKRSFDVNALKTTRYKHLISEIVRRRKEQLLNAKIYFNGEKYDIGELKSTVYGGKLLTPIKLAHRRNLKQEEWDKVLDVLKSAGISLKVVNMGS